MMTQDDRKAIDGLFARLSQAAANAPARDPEAEALIAQKMSAQPGSAYYLAQTVIVQEQALAHVQQRIEALEAELAEARNAPQQSGGLFGSLFGSQRPAPRRTTPQRPMPRQPMAPQGGGFLAGAAQTAMGVAGGMLIASAIGSMFADDAAAAEADPAAEDEDMLGGFDEGLDTEF